MSSVFQFTVAVPSFYHKYVFSMKQYNITSDLWKCWYLLKSGWITDKRDEKRWKAKLHWRSLFRTSNRVFFFPPVSRAPGGRSCNFLAKRGWTCGHYSADIKDTRAQEHWLYRCTLSVSFCDIFLLVSVSFFPLSYIVVTPLLFFFNLLTFPVKLQDLALLCQHWQQPL